MTAVLDRQQFAFVRGFVETLPDQVTEIARDETLGVAIVLAADLKRKIARQEFRHVPLNPRYLQWKVRSGLDTRTLIATGDYLDAIRVKAARWKGGKVEAWSVGVPDRVHKPSGLKYGVLARIHEYGARRRAADGSRYVTIPPRPHWRPVWQEFLKRDKGKLVRWVSGRVLRGDTKPRHTLPPQGKVDPKAPPPVWRRAEQTVLRGVVRFAEWLHNFRKRLRL